MVELHETITINAPIQRCFDLARSVEVHLAGNVHFGESALAIGGVTSGLVGLGQQVTWRAKHFALWHNLTSQITAIDPPAYFQDTMVRGIFRSMQHDHYFQAISPDQPVMKDIFRCAAPIPILGPIAEKLFLRRYMQTLLHERNAIIQQIAESSGWQQYLPL